ncbi:hypothetical protein [Peribacillus sp. SCS-155]|uniref:hypothetical protein n=1 Tax=Peribacillus sedimenti TaxID=3115297 RepID=UPI003906A5BE
MKITLFIEADGSVDANHLVVNFKNFAAAYEVKTSIISVEKYWKIEQMYEALLNIEETSEGNVPKLLNHIASNWMELPHNILASRTMDHCQIFVPYLYMINVFRGE